MSDDGQPAQRRDNGLSAERYVALADVDPRLGEHLLDLLRLADIPAYLEPPTDPRVSVRYRTSGPIERLFVQSTLRAAARDVVVAAAGEAGAVTHPEPAPRGAAGRSGTPASDPLAGVDTDAEFARIVAGFGAAPKSRSTADDRETDAQDSDDRVAEDTGTEHAGTEGGVNDASAREEITGAMLDAAAAQRTARERAFAERPFSDDPLLGEDHFQPPTPPPVPLPSWATLGCVLLVVFGIFVIAAGGLIGLGADITFPLGVVSLLGGAGILVSRMTHRGIERDDDDDDGAVI
jgi:hypothetical protein